MPGLTLVERAMVAYGAYLPDHPLKWWLHETLRRGLGVDAGGEREVTRQGIAWSLDPADHAHESLFWLGAKDTWDLRHLLSMSRPGDVALDVGANFGYHAIHLARALGPSGRVHALEPNPSSYKRLCRTIALNGFEDVVKAHKLGVSDRAGVVRMGEPPGNSGHAAVDPDGAIGDVRLTTIDQFVASERLERLDTIVLDVEGLERQALAGARETLGRLKPRLMVELFPPVMERQGSSPESAAALLAELGYRLFAARRGRLEPLGVLPSGDLGVNAFAFHQSRAPR